MRRLLFAALFVVAGGLPACDENPPLEVANVDLGRFQGTWYEIAKLPRHTESGCVGTTATYRLVGDGKLAVESAGTVDGAARKMVAEALVTDSATPGKL